MELYLHFLCTPPLAVLRYGGNIYLCFLNHDKVLFTFIFIHSFYISSSLCLLNDSCFFCSTVLHLWVLNFCFYFVSFHCCNNLMDQLKTGCLFPHPFHSLFTDHPIIRCYIVKIIDDNVEETTNENVECKTDGNSPSICLEGLRKTTEHLRTASVPTQNSN